MAWEQLILHSPFFFFSDLLFLFRRLRFPPSIVNTFPINYRVLYGSCHLQFPRFTVSDCYLVSYSYAFTLAIDQTASEDNRAMIHRGFLLM